MPWLFWFVVVGLGLTVVLAVVAWFVYPVRQRTRAANADFYRDPANGTWMHVPATRRELWGRRI